MNKKNLDRKNALSLTAAALFITAAVLVALTLIMGTQVMDGKYREFLDMLLRMEEAIIELPYKWLIVIAIFLVFMLKNFIPIPMPFICLITGMVFDTNTSILINTVGFSMLLTTKYFWGKFFGGGTAIKTLKKYDNVRDILEKQGIAKFLLLIALRLIPSIPVSTVSKIYGGIKYPFGWFMLASILGFFPKIWSYSYAGANIFHPFTWKFMAPIVVLLIVTGAATLIVNIILEKRKGDNKNGKYHPVEE